jgi:hypothetical protein
VFCRRKTLGRITLLRTVAEPWIGFVSQSDHPSAWKKGNILHLLPCLERRYSSVQRFPHRTKGKSPWSCHISAIFPSRDMFDILYKNQAILSFAHKYQILNWQIDHLTSESRQVDV